VFKVVKIFRIKIGNLEAKLGLFIFAGYYTMAALLRDYCYDSTAFFGELYSCARPIYELVHPE